MLKYTLALAALLTTPPLYAQEKNFIDMPYLEVAGSADSLVTPDEIFIKINISEKDTRDKISLEEQEAALYRSLKGIGIDTDKELRVHDMASVYKTYLLKSTAVIKSREYVLKVYDAPMAGKVFAELEKLNVANANIMGVGHSSMGEIRNALRTRAVLNARTRAVALTQPLNQGVGAAIYLEDVEQYGTQPGYARRTEDRLANTYYEVSADKPVDIDFAKIKVSAQVKAKFALK